MANEEQLAILRQGVTIWNRWRRKNASAQIVLRHANFVRANLEGANLRRADLGGANLRRADLRGANLEGAYLGGANLFAANLEGTDIGGANLFEANLGRVNLSGTNLEGANLGRANLGEANLSRANLGGANLEEANLGSANLGEANLEGAKIGTTVFASLDLRNVRGLETLYHVGPSTVGIDTLYRSAGQIPEAFLRGCGVPDTLIEYLPSLIGALQPVQHYSCFISYSSMDDGFARRLYERMRGDHLRVWFAPEDLKGGEKLFEQIDQAIRVYEKIILVLSNASLTSAWVHTEVRRARAQEQRAGKRKLFPIRVVPIEQLQAWELFDADAGTDLAAEVRSYFIPDFSTWKEHDAFEDAYARLLRDLKAAS